jgi:hypothetical protein
MSRWVLSLIRTILSWVVIVAVVVAIEIVINKELGPRRDGERRRREVIAELDRTDPDWRLEEIEAARKAVPGVVDLAPIVNAVAGQIPDDLAQAQVFRRIGALSPEALPATDVGREVCDRLDGLRAAVTEARRLADHPRGSFPISYQANVFDTPLPHHQKARVVAWLLSVDAFRLAQEKDGDGALRSCRAILNLAAAAGDVPIFVCQLVRLAIRAVACQAIERTVAQSEPSGPALAETQAALEREGEARAFHATARGERATLFHFTEQLRVGRVTFEGAAGQEPSLWSRIANWHYVRYHSGDDVARALSVMNAWVAAAKLPTAEWAAAVKEEDQKIQQMERTPLFHLLPAVTKISEHDLRNQAQLRCTIALIAAERHRRDRGRLPESLAALVPKYLQQVPADPYDGQPLRFRRQEGRFIIYSIGPDRKNHGGTFDRKNVVAPGTDLGCILWDVSRRRQSPQSPGSPP